MPEIGEKVRFKPAAFADESSAPHTRGKQEMPRMVTGRIVYINAPHRFYDVEYEVNGYKLREAFKF